MRRFLAALLVGEAFREVTFMNTTTPTPHNPDNLTPSQIGEGWRLLHEDEILPARAFGPIAGLCVWQNTAQHPYWIDNTSGASKACTYRTRLTRAELRAARGLEAETISSCPACAKGHAFASDKHSQVCPLFIDVHIPTPQPERKGEPIWHNASENVSQTPAPANVQSVAEAETPTDTDSATPETDAEEITVRHQGWTRKCVNSKLARKLERERNALRTIIQLVCEKATQGYLRDGDYRSLLMELSDVLRGCSMKGAQVSETISDVADTQIEKDFFGYIATQFPATVGHLPLIRWVNRRDSTTAELRAQIEAHEVNKACALREQQELHALALGDLYSSESKLRAQVDTLAPYAECYICRGTPLTEHEGFCSRAPSLFGPAKQREVTELNAEIETLTKDRDEEKSSAEMCAVAMSLARDERDAALAKVARITRENETGGENEQP